MEPGWWIACMAGQLEIVRVSRFQVVERAGLEGTGVRVQDYLKSGGEFLRRVTGRSEHEPPPLLALPEESGVT